MFKKCLFRIELAQVCREQKKVQRLEELLTGLENKRSEEDSAEAIEIADQEIQALES